MKRLSKLLIILVIISLTVFFSRWMFAEPFNLEYLEDLYSNSQWRIPMSSRVMSDNELYSLAGYKLLTGTPLDRINPEVPPLGKYIYGVSTVLFGTPYIASLLLYVGSIFVFWMIARTLHHNDEASFWSVLLFALSPLLAFQLSATMLDLPQLFFLLVHVFAMLMFSKADTLSQRLRFLVTAGLTLGWFGAVKIGVFVPVIGLADAVWVYITLRQRKTAHSLLREFMISGIVLGGAVGAGYLSTYIPYFVQGNSIIDWLKYQKWMVAFYSGSREESPVSVLLTTIFTGWYKGWWNNVWQQVIEWNILWPLTFIGLVAQIVQSFRRKRFREKSYVAVLGLLLLLAIALIPFWPRYFLLILPLGILIVVPFLLRHAAIKLVITIIVAAQFLIFFRPQPYQKLQFAVESWNKGQYRDVYTHFSSASKASTDPETFVQTMAALKDEIDVSSQSAKLEIPSTHIFQNRVEAQITIKLDTPLGTYTKTSPVVLERTKNQWQLDWNWNIIAEGFTPKTGVVLSYDQVDGGKLISKDNIVLSKQVLYPFALILKKELPEDPHDTLKQLSPLLGKPDFEIENQLFVEGQHQGIVEIGFLPETHQPSDLETLKTIPSIMIENRRRRVINPVLMQYAKEIAELEAQHLEVRGEDGGTIILKLPNDQSNILLEKDSIPSKDVVLDKDLGELLGPAAAQLSRTYLRQF